MSHSGDSSDQDWSLRELDRIDAVCDEFERGWNDRHSPRIEDALDKNPDLPRSRLLLELVRLELHLRRSGGELPKQDQYLSRFLDEQSMIARIWRDHSATSTPGAESDELPPTVVQPGTAQSSDSEPEKIGRYKIIRKLGQGAFGVVYLAHDPIRGHDVALKVPHPHLLQSPDQREIFKKEAQIGITLDHPHLVKTLEIEELGDQLFVVLQFVEGCNLAEWHKRNSPTANQVAELAAIIAGTLAYVHGRGYTHRDLKPANILIDRNEHVYIVDFGMTLHEDEQRKHKGELAGTLAYMSPEQIRRQAHLVDGQSDLWSVGVLLYRLLTDRLPFGGPPPRSGSDYSEYIRDLEREIPEHDPRPLRMIRPDLSRKLEEICLRCLEKRKRDRYQTGNDLADDLRLYLEKAADSPQTATSQRAIRIVPKGGLRSFDASDAEFFLELVPGPRTSAGLPASLNFWRNRLSGAGGALPIDVGVIYGPSGCGKSSLVKAGLIPILGEKFVPLVIEATSEDTEVRLLKALRQAVPGLPAGDSLVDVCRRVGERGAGGGRRILLVFDQFEQWLHSHPNLSESQLLTGLKNCNGTRLQALFLVRDDFWMPLTRFMDQLEIPLQENNNAAPVDLFDRDHARKILIAFGRAYDRPPADGELTAGQKRFLTSAIEGLSEGGRIICVRLALFAEMMKDRPWTPEELAAVGGAKGIGVAFLDQKFGSQAPLAYRAHRSAVPKALDCLLPPHGSELKGQMRTIDELREAAGCSSPRAFDDLIRILDSDLKLLTPSTPDIPDGRPQPATQSSPAEPLCYQLTHDYLVPSIRDWLNRKRRETRSGRAELLLDERARLWNASHDRKQLPSMPEWVQIRCLTRKRDWNTREQQMLKAASRFHGIRATVGLATFTALAVVAFGVLAHLRASWLIDSLGVVETAEAESVIKEIQSYSFWTRAKVREMQRGPLDRNQQLRFDLAAFTLGDEVDLTQAIFHAQPADLELILRIIDRRPRDPSVLQPLWTALKNDSTAGDHRFRAACGLANLDADSTEWPTVADIVTELLLFQERHLADEWIRLLRPVGHQLADSLQARFQRAINKDSSDRYVVALALAEFCQNDPPRLVALLKLALTEQALFLSKLEKDQSTATALIEAEFAKEPAPGGNMDEQELLAIQRARLGTALILLGSPETVWPEFEHNADPTLRYLLIDQQASWHVDPVVLWTQFLQSSSESARYALVLALAEYPPEELVLKIGADILTRLDILHKEDPNPGVHSAIAWLQQRLNPSPTEPLAQREVPYSPINGKKWYVDVEGHTLAVINSPGTFPMGSPHDEPDRQSDETQHNRILDYSFAIATIPVTIAQYRRSEGIDRSDPQSDINCPIDYVDHTDAMRYCNWLSLQNKIPFEEWCYEIRDDAGKTILHPVNGMLSKTGYRLPTEAEWEFACRARTVTHRFCGNSQMTLAKYAWYLANSEGRKHAVAQLRPNEYGLFDVYGNVCQWCQTSYHEYDLEASSGSLIYQVHGSLVYRGCTFDSRPSLARSARRGRALSAPLNAVGFRVARSLH